MLANGGHEGDAGMGAISAMPHAHWPKDREGSYVQIFAYPGGNTSDKALREVRRTPCQGVGNKNCSATEQRCQGVDDSHNPGGSENPEVQGLSSIKSEKCCQAESWLATRRAGLHGSAEVSCAR